MEINDNDQKLNYYTILFFEKIGNINPTQIEIDMMEAMLARSPAFYSSIFDERLNDKEKLCLLLASEGRTITESALLLRVNFETIQGYYDSIKQKLVCETMEQAIFVGISKHTSYLN